MAEKDLPVFYLPDAAEPGGVLGPDESHHCLQVLRLKPGGLVQIVDGKGNFFEAVIAGSQKNSCRFKTLHHHLVEKHAYHLHVAIAPTKNNDRFEWFLEKAVELGVDEITPLLCRHSVRTRVNDSRMQRVVVSAMKQSRRAWLPMLHKATPFNEAVTRCAAEKKFLCTMEAPVFTGREQFMTAGGSYCFLVGPEGDFSADETSLAVNSHFIPLSLGAMRLRTETAGIHICSLVNLVHTFYK